MKIKAKPLSKDEFFAICTNANLSDLQKAYLSSGTSIEERITYVAFREGDETVALVAQTNRKHISEILFFSVTPKSIHRGIGSQIFDILESEAQNRGADHILVGSQNAFLDINIFLLKRGYQIQTAENSNGETDILFTKLIAPRHELRLSLTEACNFKCIFCHNEGMGTHKIEHCEIDQYKSLLPSLIHRGFTDITLTGGEPLLEFEKVKAIVEFLGDRKEPPALTVVTNGAALTQRVVDVLKNYPGKKKINLSMHATNPEDFNTITGAKSETMFHKVITNVKNAIDQGIPVKFNYVVLKDLNHTQILDAIALARDTGAFAIKFLELLVLPETPDDYGMFYTLEAVERQIQDLVLDPELVNLRQTNFRLKSDSQFIVELSKCPCAIGCNSCLQLRQRAFGPDLHYHPCFVLSNSAFNTLDENALDKALVQGDELIKQFARKYGDMSPTLIKKEEMVPARRELFFQVDSCANFAEYLRENRGKHLARTGFDETYYMPKYPDEKWKEFRRVLKLSTEHHNDSKCILLLTDHQYEDIPPLGLASTTSFLKKDGPMEFSSSKEAATLLDKLDFKPFMSLTWQLDFYECQRVQINLGRTENLETIKVVLQNENLNTVKEIISQYEGTITSINSPLPAYHKRYITNYIPTP